MTSKYPKVGVAVLVIRDGKILLGIRKGSDGEGTWGNPGGKLEYKESPEECAIRELSEETGLIANLSNCKEGPWVNVILPSGEHYISIFVIVTNAIGDPDNLEPDKCDGWSWFYPNQLPHPLFDSVKELTKKVNLVDLIKDDLR